MMSAVPKVEAVARRAPVRLFYVGFALFATWIVWGSTYLAIKIALPGFAPFVLMGSRFLVAGLLLLLVALARGTPFPSFLEWRSAFTVGTLLLVGGAGGTAFAERSVASGLAASCVAFEPALILLMGMAFKNRPTLYEVIGISLGLLGVVLLIRGRGFSASPVGLAAMTAATVSWSLGSVLATNALRSAPGLAGAASQMICGGLVLLIVSRLSHEPMHWPVPFEALAAWLYLVLFGSMLAFTAFAYLLSCVQTSVAMSYTFINPIVAVVLGWVFGAEHLTVYELSATGVIAAGVVLLLRHRGPAKSAHRPVAPAERNEPY
jgi:drug/metabolite transporter (DMT)-like permease